MSIDEFLDEFKAQFSADPTAHRWLDSIIAHWLQDGAGSEAELLDTVATRLAYSYATKQLDFDFCGVLMRRLQAYSAYPEKERWPTLFWEIFVAFDAGEFYHAESEPRDVAPSELHTRPMVEAILGRLQAQPSRAG